MTNYLLLYIYSGQVGHDDPPTGSIRKVPALEGNEHLFDLKGQILHKVPHPPFTFSYSFKTY